MRHSAFIIASLLVLPAGVAGQDFDDVQISTIQVTPSIYMMQGSGGNIGVLIGNDGTLIVDDQFAPLTDKIVAAIAELTDEPVEYVVNTHFHYDHTDGNENFGRLGAAIVAHENSRVRMLTDQYVRTRPQPAYSPAGLPEITFDQSIRVHFNGQTIDIFHLGRAHTDGDAVVYFREANVIHTGDVFVRYGLPFIDEGNGGTINGMIRFVDAVTHVIDENTVVIPGHGSLATRQDVVEYGVMIRTIRDRVQAEIDRGRSLEQILQSNPTEGFGPGDAEEFMTNVYNNLVP